MAGQVWGEDEERSKEMRKGGSKVTKVADTERERGIMGDDGGPAEGGQGCSGGKGGREEEEEGKEEKMSLLQCSRIVQLIQLEKLYSVSGLGVKEPIRAL